MRKSWPELNDVHNVVEEDVGFLHRLQAHEASFRSVFYIHSLFLPRNIISGYLVFTPDVNVLPNQNINCLWPHAHVFGSQVQGIPTHLLQ